MSAAPQPEDPHTALILKAAAQLGVLGGGARAGRLLLATLCNPDVTAADIAAVVDREPGLAVRVLKVANSAYYGLTRSIATVERAVMILGLDAVRGIAAAACLDRAATPATAGNGIDMDAMLRHSIAVASASEQLARLRHPHLASEAFMAGLLHDLGILVKWRLDSTGGVATLPEQRGGGQAAFAARVPSQPTHEYCASVVFEDWKLPPSLVAAAGHHHAPAMAPAPYRDLASIIHVGDSLSRSAGLDFEFETDEEHDCRESLEALGLSSGEVQAVTDGLPERTRHLHQALVH